MKKLLLLALIPMAVQAYTSRQYIDAQYIDASYTEPITYKYENAAPKEYLQRGTDIYGNQYGQRYNTNTGSVDFYQIDSRTGTMTVDTLGGW